MRIYLDNAATTWPKPEAVYQAITAAQRDWGIAAGRGVTREAAQVARMLAELRGQLVALLNADSPGGIVFTVNGTAALNLAIHGWLLPGDHAICTAADHNSALRPLRWLEQTAGVAVTRVPCDAAGWVDPAAIASAWRANTRLVTCTHAGNVTGTLLPAAEIGRIARERNGYFLLDAAQTLGQIPVDVAALNVDLLAAPGHKSLLGPLGTGVLYVGPRCREELRPLIQGGTGSVSEQLDQPWDLPERFESGNQNYPALAGLAEGLRWIQARGLNEIALHSRELSRRFRALLSERIPRDRLTIIGPEQVEAGVGVVSVAAAEYDPQDLAIILDQQEPRIQTRAGLHCAALIHEALGTAGRGGTLRFSWSPFTTTEEIERAVEALGRVLG